MGSSHSAPVSLAIAVEDHVALLHQVQVRAGELASSQTVVPEALHLLRWNQRGQRGGDKPPVADRGGHLLARRSLRGLRRRSSSLWTMTGSWRLVVPDRLDHIRPLPPLFHVRLWEVMSHVPLRG